MKNQLSLIIAAMCVGLGGFAWASSPSAPDVPAGLAADALSHGWVAFDGDSICGVSDLRKVSNPAVVDYSALLDATPQIKEMKKKKIDPDSVQGKALRQKAASLVNRKCEIVRSKRGHCGVWKTIRHKDGRAIPDVTLEVLGAIKNEA